MASIYVLYHANCADGLTAAWAFWRNCEVPPFLVPGVNDVKYEAVRYGEDPPEMSMGAKIFIVDFSYPRDVMQVLQDRHGVDNVTVLDHHQTAQRNLAGLPGDLVIDMSQSGAMLAWKRFNSDEAPPPLVQYVQDRDLWRWELPWSREVSAYVQVNGATFEGLEATHWLLLNAPGKVIERGRLILEAQRTLVDIQLQNAVMSVFDDLPAVRVNAATLVSEVGEQALVKFPEAELAVIWNVDSSEHRRYSLRSRRDGPDVSLIAQKRGGGGHRNAAGFTVRSF